MSVMAAGEAQSAFWASNHEPVGRAVVTAVRRQFGLVLATTLIFPLIFYALLLAVMVLRFGDFPNYVTPYNWFGGVARIIASTGSVSDMIPIILNEWLLEIGYMNYAYGNGVSEWSLLIIPHKLAIVAMIGALIGLNFALVADQQPTGTPLQQLGQSLRCGLMTSVGALCASLPGITLFWVVCHSSPSWVVSLAILGVDVSTSLAIEPIGPAISFTGVTLLVLSALLIVRDSRKAASAGVPQQAKEAPRC